MTIEQLTTFFGWVSLINILVLALTAALLVPLRSSLAKLHECLFGLDEKDLSRAYFQYLAQYKIATVIFAVAPYIALKFGVG